MRRAWRIDGRGKTATVTMTDADAEPSIPDSPGTPLFPDEKRKKRLLSYLTRSMAAAIAKVILEEGSTTPSPISEMAAASAGEAAFQ